MTDIVEQLREIISKGSPFGQVMADAAKEIDESRKQLNWAQGEIDRLLSKVKLSDGLLEGMSLVVDGLKGELVENDHNCECSVCAERYYALIHTPAQQPGMREALEAARSEIVVAISFLGRDLNTDRLTETVDSLITRLSKADADARAALAAQPPAAPVETRGAGVEMINNLTPSELANWQDDGNCNAGHAKCSAGTGEEWNPTSEQVGSACMWYRHDFGLLGPVEAAQVRTEARMWLRAWQKEIAGIRAAPQEASKP
jgi:hypothetical protein